MAIKGWSDSDRIPRLGKIALGVKDERGIPKAVDYFVVPPEVKEVYGAEPKELDILIPNENLDSFFSAHLKRYGEQYGLICRGDGQAATIPAEYAERFGQEYGILFQKDKFIHKETGQILETNIGRTGRLWIKYPCLYKDCTFYKNKKCTEVAILNVILPKVPGILGVYSLDTGSFNSYTNIRNSLKILNGIFGKVSFIPLKLKVRMQQMNPLVNGKRIKTIVPVLYIDMGDLNFEQVMQMARSKRLPTIDILPEPEEIDLEPIDENEKPDLLYPVDNYTEENVEEMTIEEDEEGIGVFKALTIPQVKPTTKGVFAVAKAVCIKGPFKEGELCEVWAGHELVNMFTNIRPDQTFKASLDEVIENEGKALIKGIAVAKESA